MNESAHLKLVSLLIIVCLLEKNGFRVFVGVTISTIKMLL